MRLSCTLLALALSFVAVVVCLVGQIGLQSACQDDVSGYVSGYLTQVQAAEQASAGIDNATLAYLNATLQPFGRFASALASRSNAVTCAKQYSLNWWAWVMQLIALIAWPLALTSDRLLGMGLPMLLYTTALVVVETLICTRSVGTRSYGSGSQSTWVAVVLAGFIIAAISNYLLMFVVPGQLRDAERKRERLEGLAKEIQL